MSEHLEEYRAKRDFERTSEPKGAEKSTRDRSRFSIQHHEASSEHYDLRLEHDGVLLSWAVAKGPSTDPADKRLAIHTEDHPVDYLDFEGSIPEGEYGAGSVIVWDIGEWENTTVDDDGNTVEVDRALDEGHLTFRLEGEKLEGGYTLQRFRPEQDHWLLIKRRDEGADARRRPTSTQPESVLSDRTVDEVAES